VAAGLSDPAPTTPSPVSSSTDFETDHLLLFFYFLAKASKYPTLDDQIIEARDKNVIEREERRKKR
jgi:hypothetical protein